MRVRFGEVTFDDKTRHVYRNDAPVHLSPKAFELLKLLLERRPAALSKGELQERLWPDTFVSEANLPTLVAEIRDAIGDDARQPQFIRTVHRYGYAFSGTVTDERHASETASVRWWLTSDLGRFPMLEGDTLVGRDEDAEIVLESPTVSRHHARISIHDGVASISDLGSKNGTYVADQRILESRELVEGDQIRVGSFLLTFHRTDRSAPTSTETTPQGEHRAETKPTRTKGNDV